MSSEWLAAEITHRRGLGDLWYFPNVAMANMTNKKLNERDRLKYFKRLKGQRSLFQSGDGRANEITRFLK
jgi:hypothetical protein